MCCCQQISAQWNEAILDSNVGNKYTIGAYGNADFSSNAITTTFAYNFLHGNYIDDNMKQQVVSNLQQDNTIGYSLNYGLYGVLYNDTVNKKHIFNFFVAIRHKSYINTSFTTDDFEVPFYGNASYAGRSAILSPFSVNSLSYQQIEFGLISTHIGRKTAFGAGLSFLAGQQYASINAGNATLYTDLYGQYLILTSNTQAMESDAAQGYGINGYGASLDVYLRTAYKLWGKNGTLSISASDIGFLWWNKNSQVYNKDTSYTYTGITINSISSLQNAAFNTINKDSLQQKYFPTAKKSFYTPIPTTVKLIANTALSEKFHLELGYWYIFNANDNGYIYAQGDKYFTKGWMASLQLGYGDYAGINFAIKVAKQFKKSKVELAINHLQGIVMPNNFGGAGVYVGYNYSF